MQRTRSLSRWYAPLALALCAYATPAMAQPCAHDTDCAAPLTCQPGRSICHQSGSMSPDGGMTVDEAVCEAGPAACTWVLTACLTDSQCTQPGWTCMPLTDAVPATSICFPKGIDCSGGRTCPAGWSCLDFATVEHPDMAAMWTATGSTKFCWPDTLSGVPNGTTNVDPTKTGITGVKGGGTEPGIGLGPTIDGGTASVGSSSDDGTTDSSSGCAMIRGSSDAGLWLCLAVVLAWRLGRKRLAARPAHDAVKGARPSGSPPEG